MSLPNVLVNIEQPTRNGYLINYVCICKHCFPGGSDGKGSACNAGDLGLISGLGRSPGEGNDNPLQYSCLENPMDGGAGGLQSTGSQRVRHDCATNFPLLSFP